MLRNTKIYFHLKSKTINSAVILRGEESTRVLEINDAHCLMQIAAETVEDVYVSEAHL